MRSECEAKIQVLDVVGLWFRGLGFRGGFGLRVSCHRLREVSKGRRLWRLDSASNRHEGLVCSA